MNIFNTKSRYSIGMRKEPVEQPADLMEIYRKVQAKKKRDAEAEAEAANTIET